MGLLRRKNVQDDVAAQYALAEAQRAEREARQALNRAVATPVFADASRYPAAARARVVWAPAD